MKRIRLSKIIGSSEIDDNTLSNSSFVCSLRKIKVKHIKAHSDEEKPFGRREKKDQRC